MAPIQPPASAFPVLDPIEFDAPTSNTAPEATSCSSCRQDIRAIYYEAAGKVICPRCRGQLEAHFSPEGGRIGRFGRAFGFGLLAAIAGTALYLIIAAVTGSVFGIVALLIGWMVGKAVFIGSGRRGGRRYQILAAVLLLVASLPILLSGSSVIGVVICGFAVWRAWRMNTGAAITITGPYRIAAASSAPAVAA